jgi:hypothetical protein
MSLPESLDRFASATLGRRVSHLTPSYLIDRARVWYDERHNPDAPWLTAPAVSILETALRSIDCGLEWGAGRSTRWFAQRTASLVSVEHSRQWLDGVARELQQRGIANVDQRYAHSQTVSNCAEDMARYVGATADLAPGSLDYVLVDGIYRAECTTRAMELLEPGGILILDNANRYLPSASRSPDSLGQSPPTPEWAEIQVRLASWRLIWTSNGVTDTALWIKAL